MDLLSIASGVASIANSAYGIGQKYVAHKKRKQTKKVIKTAVGTATLAGGLGYLLTRKSGTKQSYPVKHQDTGETVNKKANKSLSWKFIRTCILFLGIAILVSIFACLEFLLIPGSVTSFFSEARWWVYPLSLFVLLILYIVVLALLFYVWDNISKKDK